MVQVSHGRIELYIQYLIVANDISAPGIGFQSDNNQVTLVDSNEQVENLPRMTKQEIANILLDKISKGAR